MAATLDLENIKPGSLVNIGKIVDDILALFPGDSIPLSACAQMDLVIRQLAVLSGVVGALQYCQEGVTDALLAGDTAPYKRFDLLLNGIGIKN